MTLSVIAFDEQLLRKRMTRGVMDWDFDRLCSSTFKNEGKTGGLTTVRKRAEHNAQLFYSLIQRNISDGTSGSGCRQVDIKSESRYGVNLS